MAAAEAEAAAEAARVAEEEAMAAAEAEAAAEAASVVEAEAARLAADGEVNASSSCHITELLVSMGFDLAAAAAAVSRCDGDIEQALSILVEKDTHQEEEAQEEELKWVLEMTELQEMGFTNQQAARTALDNTNGDIKLAIKQLLIEERSARQ